jgi:CBS domain-containing protein
MERKTTMTNVNTLMSSTVTTCRPETSLTEVAQLMWERDCGFMPIIEGEGDRLVGVITDRDLMRKHQVRRLPVIDASHGLMGVISLNDIALNAMTDKKEVPKVAQTLAAVCQHWQEISDVPTPLTTA